jgi:2-polyprenyl-6-methoxyphenol hydroxylase-like FAD-dependent oxidoreductase
VQIGKRFTHYTEDDDGVLAHLADGTSVHGSMLVGADGAHSRVRKQFLGLEAEAAPYIPILGSGEFPRDIYEPIHNLGTAAVAVGGEGLRIIISMLTVAEDRSSARYYCAVSLRASSRRKTLNGLRTLRMKSCTQKQ